MPGATVWLTRQSRSSVLSSFWPSGFMLHDLMETSIVSNISDPSNMFGSYLNHPFLFIRNHTYCACWKFRFYLFYHLKDMFLCAFGGIMSLHLIDGTRINLAIMLIYMEDHLQNCNILSMLLLKLDLSFCMVFWWPISDSMSLTLMTDWLFDK